MFRIIPWMHPLHTDAVRRLEDLDSLSRPTPLGRGICARPGLNMRNSSRACILCAVFLICSGLNLKAQELSLMGGSTTEMNVKNSSYTWQIDYRQDFFENFASSLAYINEGHVIGHHRDGDAWEAWGNLPLFNDRIAVSLGAGAYYYYDTQSIAGNSADIHGTAPIFSFTATGYLSDRIFYRIIVNRISPSGDIKTTTAAVGVGYWFGLHRRPIGEEPDKQAPVEAKFVTEPQFTVFGGQSVVNTFLSQKALAGAVEYRQGIIPISMGRRRSSMRATRILPGAAGSRFSYGRSTRSSMKARRSVSGLARTSSLTRGISKTRGGP